MADYPTNVGLFIALTDTTPDNGASFFLAGSHLSPQEPSKEHFAEHADQVCLKAGDALIFNARTWHSGGINRTQTFRHALTMNFCRAYMKQRFDYPRLLGDDALKTMPEAVLKVLGYHSRTPIDLTQYYVPAAERLYRGNQG